MSWSGTCQGSRTNTQDHITKHAKDNPVVDRLLFTIKSDLVAAHELLMQVSESASLFLNEYRATFKEQKEPSIAQARHLVKISRQVWGVKELFCFQE